MLLLLLLLYPLGMSYEKENNDKHILLENTPLSADIMNHNLNILTSCVCFVPWSQVPVLAAYV